MVIFPGEFPVIIPVLLEHYRKILSENDALTEKDKMFIDMRIRDLENHIHENSNSNSTS